MRLAFPRGLALAAAAATAILASCAKPEPEPAPPPPPPPPPPAVTLNEGVAQAASIYVTFIRDVGTIQAGFQDAESIQAAMRKGAAYEPATLSRGMIAYASILALQSPEFVAGVRSFANDPAQRAEVVANLIRDPAYAVTLPGADKAVGLINATLGKDIAALTALADSVEEDAYTIQGRGDPRRRWAVTPIVSREIRLESVKTISTIQMLPSAEEATRLFAAANAGSGLELTSATSAAPYTPAVVNALAIAALAAMGAAGDEARANTEALSIETNAQFCLDMSKLNLFQCLAAARPSYEDIFCLGRHVIRDLATCASQATIPVPADPAIATAAVTPAPAAVAVEAASVSLTTSSASVN